jgi:hypothetical protein
MEAKAETEAVQGLSQEDFRAGVSGADTGHDA